MTVALVNAPVSYTLLGPTCFWLVTSGTKEVLSFQTVWHAIALFQDLYSEAEKKC